MTKFTPQIFGNSQKQTGWNKKNEFFKKPDTVTIRNTTKKHPQ